KRVNETIKLEGILRIFKKFDLVGKNGNFHIRCHPAVVPLFFVGEGTCRIQQGAGRLSYYLLLIITYYCLLFSIIITI
ncbi:hypothetical protein GE21DRAFT_1222748, partial [Neurospora crassa]